MATFGRDADIDLDTNPYLHRRTGAFHRDGEVWWLVNVGSKLHLTVVGDDGTRADLPPGTRHQLTPPGGVVRVVAGRADYELRYGIADDMAAAADLDLPPSDGTQTVGLELTLTPREIDFLVTFARPHLLGRNDPLPTYATVAETWAVSPKTLDNTLQSIKRKFRAAGLVRRDESLDGIVQQAVRHSLVTIDDLTWADLDGPAPRPAASGQRFGSESERSAPRPDQTSPRRPGRSPTG